MQSAKKRCKIRKNHIESVIIMIEQLFRELSELPQIEAIALGGSRASSHFDDHSDYDVYLYCTAPIPEDIRRNLLGKYCSYLEISNQFWELEDNGTLNNGIDIDILYRDLNSFCEGIANVVERHQPYNGYTTCMWHNLRTCKIIYDPNGRLAAAKERFDVPYPAELKAAILERSWKLLRTSMPAYELQLTKAAKRCDLVSINHRTAAFLESYFDLLFALNDQTHPGEKRLMQLCREKCSILPADFEKNLNTLFLHLFTSPDSIPGDLDRILTELAKLL